LPSTVRANPQTGRRQVQSKIQYATQTKNLFLKRFLTDFNFQEFDNPILGADDKFACHDESDEIIGDGCYLRLFEEMPRDSSCQLLRAWAHVITPKIYTYNNKTLPRWPTKGENPIPLRKPKELLRGG
jgi:hypothetical protein